MTENKMITIIIGKKNGYPKRYDGWIERYGDKIEIVINGEIADYLSRHKFIEFRLNSTKDAVVVNTRVIKAAYITNENKGLN